MNPDGCSELDDYRREQKFNSTTKFERERDLVCESLVNEIGKAGRWKAVVEAWKALLHVRHMADGLIEEAFEYEVGCREEEDGLIEEAFEYEVGCREEED